ncbi:hypothetical protein BDR06DRAFT_972254 [Suillus hirtellus]|nr:hypothetical protein BDR06DRAFT_972254 [Suillus hirtellus]
MSGSQSSQQHPSGAPGFPSMSNQINQDRHCMMMDAPYNFGSMGGDQSHLSPLAPGLPQQDNVFGGGSHEQSGMSIDATNRLMQNQHAAPAGHMTSSLEFSCMSPFGLLHEQQTPSHPMRTPNVNKLYKQNWMVSEKLTALEKFLLELQAALAEVQQPPQEMQKKKNVRNAVNEHPMLKTLIHPLFFELCHVNKTLKKSVHIKLLCEVEPLVTGKPYELCDQKQVWHPDWKGHVDDTVNAAYIQEIVMRLWDDEKYLELNDDEKAEKAQQWKTNSKHRACQQTVMNTRCKAAAALTGKAFEESQVKSVMAMIDTDYASEQLLYASDGDLSEDTLQRWKDAGVGDGAFMVEGMEWRSNHLSFKVANKSEGADDEDEPPTKQCKHAFDLAPSKMSNNPPVSHKKNKPAVPFKSMVTEKWLKAHLNMELLEGGKWLEGFYDMICEKDVYKQDLAYLKELNEWQKREDDIDSDNE